MERQSYLKDASYLREVVLADWNSGALGDESMGNSPQKFLPPSANNNQVSCDLPSLPSTAVQGSNEYNYHHKFPISKVREKGVFPSLYFSLLSKHSPAHETVFLPKARTG